MAIGRKGGVLERGVMSCGEGAGDGRGWFGGEGSEGGNPMGGSGVKQNRKGK